MPEIAKVNRIESMANKKKQHYVPKGYFRLFSNDEITIHSFSIKDEASRFSIPIDGQCQKPYFYSKNTEIEDAFSKMENAQLNVFKKIRRNESLHDISLADWTHIYAFLGFQEVRTKFSKTRTEEMDEYMNENMLKPLIAASEKAKELGVTMDMLKNYKIKDSSVFIREIGIVLESSWLLSDLTPILLVNNTVDPFIFSDTPVVFYNRLFWRNKDFGSTGLQSSGLQVFCPISNHLYLMLYDRNRYSLSCTEDNQPLNGAFSLSLKSDVRSINSLQVYGGASVLYSGKRRGIEIAKKLVTGIGDFEKKLNIFKSTSYSTEEEIGERFVVSKPNIPICIDLSFLKTHQPVGKIPIIRNREMVDMHYKRLSEQEGV